MIFNFFLQIWGLNCTQIQHYLDLWQESDPAPLLLQVPRLLHFDPQVLHVGEDHILHGGAAKHRKTTEV